MKFYKHSNKAEDFLARFKFIEKSQSLAAMKLNIFNTVNKSLLTKPSCTNEIILINQYMLELFYEENTNKVQLGINYREILFSINWIELQRGLNAEMEDARKAVAVLIYIQLYIEAGTKETIEWVRDLLEKDKYLALYKGERIKKVAS